MRLGQRRLGQLQCGLPVPWEVNGGTLGAGLGGACNWVGGPVDAVWNRL